MSDCLQTQCHISIIRPSTSMKMTRFWTDYYLRYDSSIPKSIGEKESWGWEKLSLLSNIAMDLETISSRSDDDQKNKNNNTNDGKIQTSGYLLSKIEDLIEMEVQKRLKAMEKNNKKKTINFVN